MRRFPSNSFISIDTFLKLWFLRLCLSDRLSPDFRGSASRLRRLKAQPFADFPAKSARRGRAVAAHRAAQPRKQIFLTCVETNG